MCLPQQGAGVRPAAEEVSTIRSHQYLCPHGPLPRYKAEQIPVAAVATGFPSGQYSLDTRLQEIKLAVAAGARHCTLLLQLSWMINSSVSEQLSQLSLGSL